MVSSSTVCGLLREHAPHHFPDCYVGATGIPDAQPDHVEIMVRFAKASLMRVTELTRSLEAQLGPGTADLAMRIGIHSGPVTAGVLRGQKVGIRAPGLYAFLLLSHCVIGSLSIVWRYYEHGSSYGDHWSQEQDSYLS